MSADEQEITQLFEDGDRALIAADVREIRRIYTDEYMQADDTGGLTTREDVIQTLTSRRIRFISMKSTGRRIRLLREDVAVVHGSEEDVVEREGKRSTEHYVYMDVVLKRDGRWQIAASQLVKCANPDAL